MKKLLLLCCFILVCIFSVHAAAPLQFQTVHDNGKHNVALMNMKIKCINAQSEVFYFPETNELGLTHRRLDPGKYTCEFMAGVKHENKLVAYSGKKEYNVNYYGKNFHRENIEFVNVGYQRSIIENNESIFLSEIIGSQRDPRLLGLSTGAVIAAVTIGGFAAWDLYSFYNCTSTYEMEISNCKVEGAFALMALTPGTLVTKVSMGIAKGGKWVYTFSKSDQVIAAVSTYGGDILALIKSKTGSAKVYDITRRGGKYVGEVVDSAVIAVRVVGASVKQKLIPEVVQGKHAWIGGTKILKEKCGGSDRACKGILGEITLHEYMSEIKKNTGDDVSVILFKGKAGDVVAESSEYIFKYGEKLNNIEVVPRGATQKIKELDGIFIVNGKLVIGEAKASAYDTMAEGFEKQLQQHKEYGDILAKVLDESKSSEAEVLFLVPKNTYEELIEKKIDFFSENDKWLGLDKMPLTSLEYGNDARELLSAAAANK